jgi:phosphatidylethanolamine/phosphatidyl-N-methylethanolamine N-methyltransferase
MTSASDATLVDSARVTNGFVDGVYAKLSPLYDVVFGRVLQPGRVAAVNRIGRRERAKVLEVGVGTGLNLPLYPRHFRVTGIDLSAPMLEKARQRLARERLRCRLVQMDAAHLTFRDNSFDVVYAPYTISVVADPVQVAREMQRVCKPGGTILILNHFRSSDPLVAGLERALSPLTVHVGFTCDVDLQNLLADAGLRPASIDAINFPPLWRLVTCVKEQSDLRTRCSSVA